MTVELAYLDLASPSKRIPGMTEKLKDLGAQGWELVSLVPIAFEGKTNYIIAVLKRPAK